MIREKLTKALLPLTIPVAILFTQISSSAEPQWQVPRTASGAPDLQGVWTNATITALERTPDLGERLVVDSELAAKLEKSSGFNVLSALDDKPSDPNRGAPTDGNAEAGYNAFWIDPGTKLMKVGSEYRTSIIVDPENGKIPYTAAAGAAFAGYRANAGFDGPEQRPLGERCLVGFGSTSGPPMLPVLYNNHYQIVQTPDYVMILVEMNHDARIIRMSDNHIAGGYEPWMGDSIGHWEGDTLVVETVNFHPQQSFRFALKHSLYLPAKAKVIERFTRVAANEITYQFTIEEPEAFSQTWSGEVSMRPADGNMYEYACHEGNYALPGILAGARVQENAQASENQE